VVRTSPHRVARVQYVDHNVRRIYHFVKLLPDAPRETLLEDRMTRFLFRIKLNLLLHVTIFRHVVVVHGCLYFCHHFPKILALQVWSLSLSFVSKRILKTLHLKQPFTLTHCLYQRVFD
jgi:hypothetical protein